MKTSVMTAESRKLQIIKFLSQSERGIVSVTALAQALQVSEMTIRRDLDWMEARSIVTRIHGGAVAYQNSALEKPFADRLGEFNAQKESIGWAAGQLVQDGERIILDAGTTTQQVARHLGSRSNLTVITNNIPASIDLARFPHIETILLGGSLKHQERCTYGPMVKQGLAVLAADKLFLSAAGFSVERGVTDSDLSEVEVKQAMIQSANEIILVADSSKVGLTKLARICAIEAVSTLVTDDAISKEALARLEGSGLKVMTPERAAQSAVWRNQKT